MRQWPARVRQGVVAVLLVAAVLVLSLPGAAPTARAAQGNQGLQGGWAVGDAGDVVFAHSLATQLPVVREAGQVGRGGFSGGSYLYPSNFAWLLKRSYAAIKSAQPGAVVVAGGLFAHDPLGVTQTVVVEGKRVRITKRGDQAGERAAAGAPGSAAEPCAAAVPAGADSGAEYLCATYRMGIAKAGWKAGSYPFDHLAQHLYLDIGGTTTTEKIGQYVLDLRGAYVAYEDAQTPKQILITEVGWTTEFVSAQTQAANLQTAYAAFGQTGYVARAFRFSVQHAPEGNLFFGPVDTNGAAKPALAAFREHAGY